MDFITRAIEQALTDGPPPRRRTSWRRDTQRSKVYAAERAAFPGVEAEGMTVKEVERFAAKLWESHAARAAMQRERGKLIPVPRVADGRGCRSASGGFGTITIPLWARSRWVVCHELAHCIVSRRPWHSPAFCRVYLELVEEALGFDARERLALEMRKRGVKTRP